MTGGSSLTEIPLAYPSQTTRQRRFVVNDANGTIHRETNDGVRPGRTLVPLYDASLEMERFRGCASVSFLCFGTKEAVVTTSALPSEPEILSVAVSWHGSIELEGASTSVELDLTKMKSFSRPVKVQCFALGEDPVEGGAISIGMVDMRGNIVSLQLAAKTLTPLQSSLKISSVSDMLKKTAEEGEEMYTDTELHSPMVFFISSSILLMALSPLLLAVDFKSDQIALWSEIQCQEEMRSRREVIGNILTTAGNILLGQSDEAFIDMPPTSALCVASDSSVDRTSFDVFTLHSDASLRRWRVDPAASLHPFEVNTLQIPGQGAVVCEPLIPPPSLWGHSFNSVALSARLYESIYAVAVHVQTIDSSMPDDISCCHLIALHGSHDIRTPVETTLHLTVPCEASSLVGMSFLPNTKRCSLRALFQTAPQIRDDFSETLLVTYPPSITSIVSAQPTVSSCKHTLDGVAKSERERICSLSFYIRDTNNTVDNDLQELDSRYMKYFFRPSYPRGSGTVLPPTDSTIRKALGKLVPGYRRSADTDMSIQLETLRAMYTWRRLENRGATSSPLQQRQMAVTAGTTTGAVSVYHSFMASSPTHHRPVDMDVDDDDDEYDTDEEERERSVQLTAHEKRWKRFLLAVWEEEHVLRSPLCACLLPNSSCQDTVLVRVGVTTSLSDSPPMHEEREHREFDILDEAALQAIARIHQDKDRSDLLSAVETSLWEIVSKAQLVLPSSSSERSRKDALSELCVLGSWSLDDEVQGIGDSSNEFSRAALQDVLGSVSSEVLISWLEAPPPTSESEVSRSLPGLSLTSGGLGTREGIRNDAREVHVPSTNTRLSACSLSVRCVDSVRHIQLARCLLLCGIGPDDSAADITLLKKPMQQAAFTMYLHSLSVLWTASQLVAMPSTVHLKTSTTLTLGGQTHKPVVGESPFSRSPPLKRASFGEETQTGLLPAMSHHAANMTTALDVQLIHLSQFIDKSLSPSNMAISLARVFFASAFGLSKSNDPNMGTSTVSIVLPELGVLPPPVLSNYPRLALRLLAPFNAYPPERDSVHVVRERGEASAECLLFEAKALSLTGAVTEIRKKEMIQKACELLVPAFTGDARDQGTNLDQIEKAVILLRSTTLGEQVQIDQECEDSLARVLQDILDTSEQQQYRVAAVDFLRLSQLHTTRSLFLPLMSSHPASFRESFEAIGMDLSTMNETKLLVLALLRLSKLLHRLSMLERHLSGVGNVESSMGSSGSELFLEYIESAISEIKELFPSSVYKSMTEYATLWSMLFRHAIAGHRWKKAYEACMNNPVLERKVNNYKRLVIAMTESGFFEELLGLSSVVSSTGSVETGMVEAMPGTFEAEGSDECIDMYEIASETLAEAANHMASATVGTANFGGCLYSLHLSHGNWKRAAQSMDMIYNISKTFLATCDEAEVGMIIEELTLSALGALHALQMVKRSSERFYISGEVGPYPLLPFVSRPVEQDSVPRQNGKRGRGDGLVGPFAPSVEAQRSEETGDGVGDRLSKYTTSISLTRRVVQTMLLRLIFLDETVSNEESPHASGWTHVAEAIDVRKMFLEATSADMDRAIIDKLSWLGYYQHALLLAKTLRDNYQDFAGGQPSGRDQVQDAVSYMLRSHLVPTAVRNSRPQPGTDEQEDGESPVRPTFSQLCRSFDEIDISVSQFTRTAWRSMDWLPHSAKGTVAMALIQKLVVAQCSTDSPIAVETAGYFLDFDSGRAQLPHWLERLLMGVDAYANGDTIGLFSLRSVNVPSNRQISCYRGDPPSLLRLYMKRGMYVEACNVVSALLSGVGANGEADDMSREQRASSRLPERGDIDFVPYRLIDVLWDLLEHAVGSPTTLPASRTRMIEARSRMETGLQKHFKLMKISEMGMQSARALTHKAL